MQTHTHSLSPPLPPPLFFSFQTPGADFTALYPMSSQQRKSNRKLHIPLVPFVDVWCLRNGVEGGEREMERERGGYRE